MIKLLTIVAATGVLQLVAAALIFPGAYAAQAVLKATAQQDEFLAAILGLIVFLAYVVLICWLAGKLYRRRRGLH